MALMMITHDLGVIGEVTDDVVVMYVGKIVEKASTRKLFEEPLHPYTKALLEAIPSLRRRTKIRLSIKGEIADPTNPPSGCRFHPRCPYKMDKCGVEEPVLKEVEKDHLVACWLY